jgi:hypothetical protein
MRYLIVAATVLLLGGSAYAGFLSSTFSTATTPSPMFVIKGQKFLAVGNNLFQANGNNTVFSQ